MANTYTLISSVTVPSGGLSLIEFTSIPQTYTDLQLVASIRYGTNNNQSTSLGLYFNGDAYPASASNRILNGTGSATSSYTNTGFTEGGAMDDTSTTANTFSSHSIYISNYTSSNYKSLSVDTVTENNATYARAIMSAGLYSSTSPITRIKCDPNSVVQYSTFYLYGIKNS